MHESFSRSGQECAADGTRNMSVGAQRFMVHAAEVDQSGRLPDSIMHIKI